MPRHKVPVGNRVAQPEELHRPVDGGGRGPQRNQRVHIRRAAEQLLKSVFKVVEVDVEDRQQQDKLPERQGEEVPVAQEESRQRPVEHMPHAEVEEQDGEHPRHNQPVLLGADGGLLLFGGVGGRFAFCRPAAGVCDRRAVPRMLDRRDQVGRRDRLFVIGDAGRIGHQADGRLGDAGGFPQRLFNVGLAGGAAHAGHVQLNLRHNHFLSIKRVVILFPSPLGKGFLWLYYSRLQSFCQ